jgi:peptide alpha-N-acetyltransferase
VNLLKNFVASSLNSGIPSTFDDVHALIASPAAKNRRSALLETALEIANDLIREDMLPITHLWALYFKAQLLDLSGNFKEAISLLDECLEHTPTAIDIYLKKADILEKIGRFLPASSVVEECRKLDLQDRYLNNYSTRMFLRADKLEEAKETIAIFTKHDGEPEKTLFDLQCCWYELEVAESMARQKMWKSALEKFSSVRQHFKDQFNDLFDFHGYCVRKVHSLRYNLCPFIVSLIRVH